MSSEIILVDRQDKEIGTGAKLKVHQEGKLHRAFSIFVFNPQEELLLQKRAVGKYHSGGLWTNTCCSHPCPEETVIVAAHRRLMEEMGFDCRLTEIFSFIYRAKLDNDLWEHEFDHVLIGKYGKEPRINPDEAEDFRWADQEFLIFDIRQNPNNYTAWFKKCYGEVFRMVREIRLRKFLMY